MHAYIDADIDGGRCSFILGAVINGLFRGSAGGSFIELIRSEEKGVARGGEGEFTCTARRGCNKMPNGKYPR